MTTSSIKPFTVTVDTGRGCAGWVPNFDRSRWFLVLRLTRPKNDELNRLLRICNGVVGGFGQHCLYEEDGSRDGQKENLEQGPGESRKKEAVRKDGGANVDEPDRSDCFHISIAWTLEDPGGRGEDAIGGSSELTDLAKNNIKIHLDVVKVKIGNVVHDVPLAQSATAATATTTR
jgi:U6 snRNA phosphodiesterase